VPRFTDPVNIWYRLGATGGYYAECMGRLETFQAEGHAPPPAVASAVEAARLAFPEWRDTPAIQRAAALRSVAGSIRAHHAELVRLLTMEEGKPLPENEEEVWWTEETFDDI